MPESTIVGKQKSSSSNCTNEIYNNDIVNTAELKNYDFRPNPPELRLRKSVSYKNQLQKKYRRKRYLCPHCDYEIDKRDRLERHIEKHYLLTEEPKYTQKRPKTNRPVYDKVFNCSDCSVTFTMFSSLRRHLLKQHSKEMPFREKPLKVKLFQDKTFKCSKCSFSTEKRSTLTSHMNIHTGNHPYHCPYCNFASSYSKNLKRHLATKHVHKNEPYQCDICKSKFSDFNAFNSHMETYCFIDLNNNICNICQAIFNNEHDLMRHVQDIHVDIHDYKTQLIDIHLKKFIKMHEVKSEFKHDIVKTEIKEQLKPSPDFNTLDFTCNICNTVFQNESSFIQHRNPSQDKANYTCKRCGAVSIDNCSFIQHFSKCMEQLNDKMNDLDIIKDEKVLVHSTVVIKLEVESDVELSDIEEPCCGF